MSIDVDVLIDTYTLLKQYVPVKERQAAADHVVSNLSETLAEPDLRQFGSIDGYTKRAVDEYLLEEDDDDNYYNDYEE
jgi:hypothetical protein